MHVHVHENNEKLESYKGQCILKRHIKERFNLTHTYKLRRYTHFSS